MKAIWKGAVGFGLVNIPVKLYSATQKSRLDLDMVDVRDLSNIKYKRVNEDSGKEVDWSNIGKAYDLDGRYILLDDADFEKASPEKNKTIQINHFIDEAEIDTIYFENSYFLEPEKSGQRAYQLLKNALQKTKKVGLSQFVLRTVETLAVIKPYEDILVLSKIRFGQEIRSTADIEVPNSKLKKEEIQMAVDLIEKYSTPFRIDQFKDEYSADLLKIIKKKSKVKPGEKVKSPKLRVVHKSNGDLLDQLKASLHKKSS